MRLGHRRYVRNLALWRRGEAELHQNEPPVAAVAPGRAVDVTAPAASAGPPRSRVVAVVSRRVTGPARRALKRARREVHRRRRASLLRG